MRTTTTSNRRLFDVRGLSGVNGTEGRFSVPRGTSEILVSVKRGSVDLWFGEFLGSREVIPHLHFGQTNAPVWVPIPEGTYTMVYKLEDLTSSNQIIASILFGG